MRLLALDPGGTTGWALFKKGAPGERYTSGQIPADRTWDLLESAKFMQNPEHSGAVLVEDDLIVICESFQHRQLPKVDLTPVEVIGVVKEWCRQNKVELVFQTPAQGKSFFNDTRLAELDLLRRPKTTWVHANDAMRHILWYLGFGKGIQLGEAGSLIRKGR